MVYIPSYRYIEINRDVTFNEDATFSIFRQTHLDEARDEETVAPKVEETFADDDAPKEHVPEDHDMKKTYIPIDPSQEMITHKRKPSWV